MNGLNVKGVTVETLAERGLTALRIDNQFCRALISDQGAQVLAFELKQA